MLRSLIVLIILAVAQPVLANPAKIHILPYKIWKQKKVDEAKSIVGELRRELHKSRSARDLDDEDLADEILNQKKKIVQAELNLSVVKELTANDYFVLYVGPQFKDDRLALLQAAKTLSAKDFAEIMVGYQRNITTNEGTNSNAAPKPPGGDLYH